MCRKAGDGCAKAPWLRASMTRRNGKVSTISPRRWRQKWLYLRRFQQVAPSRKAVGKIAREPNRYSGRTAMLANISVHEPKPPDDPDSALAFSMESGPESAPPSLIPFFWAPGWNSIQAINKFQSEVGGPLRGGDPGIRLIEPSQEPGWQYLLYDSRRISGRSRKNGCLSPSFIFSAQRN